MLLFYFFLALPEKQRGCAAALARHRAHPVPLHSYQMAGLVVAAGAHGRGGTTRDVHTVLRPVRV